MARRQPMKRVIIIGSSGAGKTTLAKTLSAHLGIPHTELDGLYHQKNWQPLPDDEFLRRVKDITSASEWILCGNYYSRLGDEVWPRADTIIWCNYSFVRVLSQLVRRTVRRSIGKVELWNGNRESFYKSFFTRDSILVWMIKTWNKQSVRYEQLYSQPSAMPDITLVRLKNPKETRRFLATLKK